MTAIFGMDFGTSNSALSLNRDGIISVLDIDPPNKLNSKILKSILFINEEERKIFYGQEAVDNYFYYGSYGRYVQSIKSILTFKNIGRTRILGKVYELDEMVSFLIRQIKKCGEEISKCEVDSVVVGRPVIFSQDEECDKLAKKRLVSAVKKAGFKNVYLQYEPIAAALFYESTLSQGEEKIVLIGDFGGGTSDFSIVKVRGGKQEQVSDRKNDIIAIDGINIGGDVFDSLIMKSKLLGYFGEGVQIASMFRENEYSAIPAYLLVEICQWHLVARMNTNKYREIIRDLLRRADRKKPIINLINYIENNCGYMLYQSIEKAKIKLSAEERSTIIFNQYGIEIDEEITRVEFEEIANDSFRKIENCLFSVMKKAGIRNDEIGAIFLTGGTSYIPKIRNIFTTNFPNVQIQYSDAFTSVVHGLGLHGSLYI